MTAANIACILQSDRMVYSVLQLMAPHNAAAIMTQELEVHTIQH